MPGLVKKLIGRQDQSRHENKYRYKTDSNTLGQSQTKVRTYTKLHQAQGQKADDSGKTTGENGCGRHSQGLHHGLADKTHHQSNQKDDQDQSSAFDYFCIKPCH